MRDFIESIWIIMIVILIIILMMLNKEVVIIIGNWRSWIFVDIFKLGIMKEVIVVIDMTIIIMLLIILVWMVVCLIIIFFMTLIVCLIGLGSWIVVFWSILRINFINKVFNMGGKGILVWDFLIVNNNLSGIIL